MELKWERYRRSRFVGQALEQANNGRSQNIGNFVIKVHDHADNWFEQSQQGGILECSPIKMELSLKTLNASVAAC